MNFKTHKHFCFEVIGGKKFIPGIPIRLSSQPDTIVKNWEGNLDGEDLVSCIKKAIEKGWKSFKKDLLCYSLLVG